MQRMKNMSAQSQMHYFSCTNTHLEDVMRPALMKTGQLECMFICTDLHIHYVPSVYSWVFIKLHLDARFKKKKTEDNSVQQV